MLVILLLLGIGLTLGWSAALLAVFILLVLDFITSFEGRSVPTLVTYRIEGSDALYSVARGFTHAIVGEHDSRLACAAWMPATVKQATEQWIHRYTSSSYDFPTSQAYVDHCVAEMAAYFNGIPDGKITVLQWSKSERAARNALGSHATAHYRNVRVVPVQRVSA